MTEQLDGLGSPLTPTLPPRLRPLTTRALVRALRPRQWVKNVIVMGAPLGAGQLTDPAVLRATLLAMVAFCAASSAVYLLNDVRDAEADRQHPVKRLRPVASGELSANLALAACLPLAVAALLVSFSVTAALGYTVLAYLGIQVAYATVLKDQPALDLVAVASGFLLRAVAGGTATGIVLSPWFLLVAAFGSLFMVAGKRYSEIHRLGPEALSRRSLRHYSETYLRFIWTMAAGVTVVVYICWALFGGGAGDHVSLWGQISVAPFVVGLMRYAADIDRGMAESPEDIVLSDRHLQVIGGIWVLTIVLQAMGR